MPDGIASHKIITCCWARAKLDKGAHTNREEQWTSQDLKVISFRKENALKIGLKKGEILVTLTRMLYIDDVMKNVQMTGERLARRDFDIVLL